MRNVLVLLLVLLVTNTSAQIANPISWTFSSKKINATTYEVRFAAKIEEGWHLYSQNTPAGGPIPTSIAFSKNPLIVTKGAAVEVGELETHFEKLFGVEVKQYSDKVAFVQSLSVKQGVKTKLAGSIEYMTCNDEECLPPKKQSFAISLK